MSIRALPQDVVDRIAAGEVVERPASVVKELIENALDAGATSIRVEVEGGGIGLVRVVDDGHGIAEDQLPLAFASHATSKLHDVDDLFHIASFGFRGEALSSIAAVSRSRITSAVAGAASGFRLDCHAGVPAPATPCACPQGTAIEVRDLFFNTPARRRFLGAISTESARCREVVAAVATVHPGVRFELVVDGKTRFTIPGDLDLGERIAAIYGKDFRSELVWAERQEPGTAVEGYISLPAGARARPRAQQLFVNGRLVRDRSVQAAVRSGCKDFLPGSLHPAFVLQLTIDPQRLDVNVHPTKAEVRFRDRDRVFSIVRGACRDALLGSDLAPRVRVALPTPSGAVPPVAAPRADGLTSGGLGELPLGTAALSGGAVAEDAPGVGRGGVGTRPAGGPVGGGHPPASPAVAAPAPRAAQRYVQILRTYIAHDSDQGLVLVDQHALHERVLYARLQGQLARGEIESQRLLVPETIRLDPGDYDRALLLADELARFGLVVAAFGEDTVAVQAVPAVLRNESLPDLLRALVDPPDAHGGIPHGLDRRLFTMACHAAVKAGDALDESEVAALFQSGAEIEHDATCPHGRPTRIVIGADELERLFKRTGF